MDVPKFFHHMRHSKSTREISSSKEFPNRKDAYMLLEIIGRGVTATVWRAECAPLREIVAIKLLDLERMNVQMEEVIHEAQTMCLYNHPNVLSLHTAFVEGKDLWLVEPYVDGGSVLNIMKYKFPNGLDELVIAVVMKEVAKALEYVHRSGGIHRDVKAGNILINTDGSVLLADFGVAATIQRGGSWGNDKINRNTFVGTPCWMAPEVMEQKAGYDSKADIWSFGITMLELAHGSAPFAKFPPIKVLLMTIQNPPPQLEASGQRHFSKGMRDLVAQCLQKDASLRPSASQVLESKFFKAIPETKYLVSHLVGNLPSLAARAKMLNDRDVEVSGESSSAASEAIKTKEEYVRGMSGWNFEGIVGGKKSSKDATDLARTSITETRSDAQRLMEEMLTDGLAALLPERQSIRVAVDAIQNILEKSSAEHIRADQRMHDSSSRAEQPVAQTQEPGPLSPTKKGGEAPELSGKNPGHEKNGKSSRFLVTTDSGGSRAAAIPVVTEPPPISEPAPGQYAQEEDAKAHAKQDDAASSAQGEAAENGQEKFVGRFRVRDKFLTKKEATVKDAKPAAQTSAPAVPGGPFVPPATVLSSSLQSFLSRQKQMCGTMERMVEALKEAEKGQPAALRMLVSSLPADSHEALVHRIKELEVENKGLRERNLLLEQQLSNLSTPSPPQEKH